MTRKRNAQYSVLQRLQASSFNPTRTSPATKPSPHSKFEVGSNLLQSKHIQQPNPSLKFFLTSARPDSRPSTQLHRTQDRHLLDPPSMTGPATISSRSKSNPRFDQRPSRAPPKLLGLLCCVKCRLTGNRSGNPLIRIVQFQVIKKLCVVLVGQFTDEEVSDVYTLVQCAGFPPQAHLYTC